MEFFNKAQTIRLKSHLGKYLVADDDEETIRQSRNGSSRKERWTVELVQGNSHLVRLRSCHDKYLSASDEPFLLGWTGKKVVQKASAEAAAAAAANNKDASIDWEPIREGHQVKLRTRGGKFLRGNGGTPPWRNSITHDLPHRTATQDWVLWDVDVLDISHHLQHSSFGSVESFDSSGSSLPPSSYSSLRRDDSLDSDTLSMPRTPQRNSILSRNSWLSMKSDRSSSQKSMSQRQVGESGMEFFSGAKAVRLQSHLGKYLIADDDEKSVRQSRNGSSHRARWVVEHVQGKSNVIRLKSSRGLYLTASEEAFLLGMTGKKVVQSVPSEITESCVEWEPIKEGSHHVKLQTSEGRFLRGNGATPPWRNSITHDTPHRTATQDWVLWGVEIVDIDVMTSSSDMESTVVGSGVLSPAFICKLSAGDEDDVSPDNDDMGSPSSVVDYSQTSRNSSMKLSSGMDMFKKASVITLRSHHDKYLTADSDQETVVQERDGACRDARWTVEFVEGFENVLRLKSSYGKYLTAVDEQLLLGVTGRRVQQTLPRRLDSSVEWEPIRDGFQVRLKTRYGNYLRANGGLPPWRNSISHDVPHRHKDWILWFVEVVENRPDSPRGVSRAESFGGDLSSSSFHLTTPGFSLDQPGESASDSAKKSEGRMVYYSVVEEEEEDDDDNDSDDSIEERCFQFKGHWPEELALRLEEETGLENIIVCSRNKINGQLYPMRLALPPNNATMHVVVVPSTSKVAAKFRPETTQS